MKKWLKPLVLWTTIALAVGPILADRSHGMKARWAFARVAILADQGDPDASQELEKVAQSLSNPEQHRDYWLVKQKIALKNGPPSEAIAVARRALRAIPDFHNPAWIAYEHFHENMDYRHALEALLLYYGGELRILPNHPSSLNHVAYARSLALIDLDQALIEIDLALERYPDEYNFLDTRAWILFQMGRLLEALDDANRAVEKATRDYVLMENSWKTHATRWLSGRVRPKPGSAVLSEIEAEPWLWGLGSTRYHRGRILEALGRTDEAEQDWQWLDEHRLPRDERLR